MIPARILPLYICPSPGTSKLSIPASKGSLIVLIASMGKYVVQI